MHRAEIIVDFMITQINLSERKVKNKLSENIQYNISIL